MREAILTVGSGEGESYLGAFDAALLAAGIANFNLIKISSILPGGTKITIISNGSEKDGEYCEVNSSPLLSLKYGTLLPTVYTYFVSSNYNEEIAAAIGIAKIKDSLSWGVIMEKSGVGSKEEFEEEVHLMLNEATIRRRKVIEEIKIISVKHKVKKFGAVVAACAIINYDLYKEGF